MKRDMMILMICLCALAIPLLFGEAPDPAEQTFAPGRDQHPVLVLDAGHGGEDGGAVSAAGDKESDINLAIVLKLDQIMGLCGVPVVLTRSEDRSIHDPEADTLREKKVSDLHNRVELVEALDQALLLSVHQNSFPDSRYSGAQVFYGAAEGSQLWGEYTQEVLRVSLDNNNTRGAKRIPDTVYLMNHVTCPAILVECGFMSNGEEVSLLLTSAYQKKMAAVLAGACLQYFQMGT